MKTKENGMTQLNFLAAIDETPLLDTIVTPSTPNYKDFLAQWSKANFFVLDIETTHNINDKGEIGCGLNPYNSRIRLIQIGLQDGQVLIYDCFKDNCPTFLRVLKQTLENPQNIAIGHNFYFDLSFLRAKYGIKADGVRCTRVMSTMRWSGLNKYYKFSLAAVYERLTGQPMSKEQQRSDWSQPNLSNSQLNYAALDITNTFTVFLKLCKELKSFDAMPDLNGNPCQYKLTDIVKIECNSIPGFVEMGFNGMPVNIEKANQAIELYQSTMEDLYKPVLENLGVNYSAASEKLAIAIYRRYGIWLIAEDPDGAKDDYKVKIKQLNFLFENPPKIENGYKITTSSAVLFQYYLETREEDLLRVSLTRSLKKHLDTLINLRDSAVQHGGIARTRYTSLGSTATGRSASSGDRIATTKLLNLQNLPNPILHSLLDEYNLPNIRSVIEAPEGYKLSINDYAGSHLNLAIRLSGDEKLASTKTLSDPHALFTSEVCQALGHGEKYTVEYCAANKKKDPVVKATRSKSKTA